MAFFAIVTVIVTVNRYDWASFAQKGQDCLQLFLGNVGEFRQQFGGFGRSRQGRADPTVTIPVTLPQNFLEGLFQFCSRLYDVVVLHNPVSDVHGVGFVAHDSHTGDPVETGPAHQALRRPPEIVKVQFGDSRLLDRLFPLSTEILDLRSDPAEDPGTIWIEFIAPLLLFGKPCLGHYR